VSVWLLVSWCSGAVVPGWLLLVFRCGWTMDQTLGDSKRARIRGRAGRHNPRWADWDGGLRIEAPSRSSRSSNSSSTAAAVAAAVMGLAGGSETSTE